MIFRSGPTIVGAAGSLRAYEPSTSLERAMRDIETSTVQHLCDEVIRGGMRTTLEHYAPNSILPLLRYGVHVALSVSGDGAKVRFCWISHQLKAGHLRFNSGIFSRAGRDRNGVAKQRNARNARNARNPCIRSRCIWLRFEPDAAAWLTVREWRGRS